MNSKFFQHIQIYWHGFNFSNLTMAVTSYICLVWIVHSWHVIQFSWAQNRVCLIELEAKNLP